MNRHHAWILAILVLLCTVVAQTPAATISITNDSPFFSGAFRKDFSTECSDAALTLCEVASAGDLTTWRGEYQTRNLIFDWDLELDADPGISGTINITNKQPFTQFFATEVGLVIDSAAGEVPAGGLMTGASLISVSTTFGESATLSAAGGDSIYSGIIAGTTERELFSAASLSITPPTLFDSDFDSFSNESTSTALQIGDVLSLRHAFLLTADDMATAVSSFSVFGDEPVKPVPEPSTFAILVLGLAGCLYRREKDPEDATETDH